MPGAGYGLDPPRANPLAFSWVSGLSLIGRQLNPKNFKFSYSLTYGKVYYLKVRNYSSTASTTASPYQIRIYRG